MRISNSALTIFTVLFSALLLIGCGEVLDEKKTEIEAKRLLEAASEIRKDLEVDRPVPERITSDTEIQKTSQGVKLFYYTKNHSPQYVENMLKKEFKVGTARLDSANQLIISCGNEKLANEILDFLKLIDIPPIQVRINCVIAENYADLTMDKETRVEVEEVFSSDVAMTPKGDGPSFPGASIRETERSDMGMELGYSYSENGEKVETLVDMLVSRGYFKVLLNPTVETLVGEPAQVTSSERVPITKIVTKNNIQPYQETEYIWIEDKLKVTPYVYQNGTIGLKTEISIGSKSTPEGVVQRPVITEKKATFSENRIRIGESLIIGGFRKMENSAVTRGYPFLKDLPFIGMFFSGDDYEQRAKEITIILTPSISGNGRPYEETMDWAENKLESRVKDKDLSEIIGETFTSPLGTESQYTEKLEKDAAEQAISRIKTEIDINETERELKRLKDQVQQLETKLNDQKLKSQEAKKVNAEYKNKLNQLKQLQDKLQKHLEDQKAKARKAQQQKEAAQKKAQQQKKEVAAEKKQAQTNKQQAEKPAEKKEPNAGKNNNKQKQKNNSSEKK
ncbi:General secretion pathway protein D [Sedimentisphaera cyanobacteriorum]|uniref:General secretion pathway protein D n=1 Tax=Sedimentisphaera cyanobacteriorum TaxID=1940790 RepID=A0A1Q2HPU8_9BACT|nr:hypothetical protein [Sedimentisphaera cyanobacteriorum]AQQ09263.1 General secretion pathway protein D [Sedimentisphaera cyanobacteriorum]